MGGHESGIKGRMMSAVSLVSGGLDSTLMAVLAKLEGVVQFPLFINYGQRSFAREWRACQYVFRRYDLPNPHKLEIPGFGATFRSGLTDKALDIVTNAFLPGRNMLFVLCGAAYAYQKEADSVFIGLLNERTHLFPDQTSIFLQKAEASISEAIGRAMKIVAPLHHFSKAEVVALSERHHLRGTYSCHRGTAHPCGKCIACREFQFNR